MDYVEMYGALCTLSSFCFQLLGIQICYGIIRKGGTGDISPFTFISYFVACVVWLKYGLLQQLPVIIATNVIGATLNCIYVFVFYRYTTKKNQFYRNLVTGCVMLVTPLLYIKYYQTDYQLALSHLGSYCVGLTIIGYGAPLVSLTDVISSKSTECLSFPLILANFILSILWTIYGVLVKDFYVQTPNFLGGVLAVLQLALFVIYPSSSNKGGSSVNGQSVTSSKKQQ